MKKKMPQLTMKRAKEIAAKVLGTSRGLEKNPHYEDAPFNVFQILMGDFRAEIRYDICDGILIQVSVCGPINTSFALYDPDTLEENFKAEELRKRRERKEAFNEWVCANGIEHCKAAVDKSWNHFR